jgi:hypothetical protein
LFNIYGSRDIKSVSELYRQMFFILITRRPGVQNFASYVIRKGTLAFLGVVHHLGSERALVGAVMNLWGHLGSERVLVGAVMNLWGP